MPNRETTYQFPDGITARVINVIYSKCKSQTIATSFAMLINKNVKTKQMVTTLKQKDDFTRKQIVKCGWRMMNGYHWNSLWWVISPLSIIFHQYFNINSCLFSHKSVTTFCQILTKISCEYIFSNLTVWQAINKKNRCS